MRNQYINIEGKHLYDYNINPVTYDLTRCACAMIINPDKRFSKRIDELVENVKWQTEFWDAGENLDFIKKDVICFLTTMFIEHFEEMAGEESFFATCRQQFITGAIDMVDWNAVIAYTGIFDSVEKFKGVIWHD